MAKARQRARKDVHATITQNIIDAIEKGQATNELPWRTNRYLPIRYTERRAYRGVNVLNLWAESMLRGYSSPYWAGFNTWKALGGSVKGKRGAIVVYSGTKERESKEGDTEKVRFMRYFTVFNRDQVSDLTLDDSAESPSSSAVDGQAGLLVEQVCQSHSVQVIVKGDEAFYTPATDTITMPDKKRFIDTLSGDADNGYASTLAHELVHASSHTNRCDRPIGQWGTVEYAREELVAELGSAFVCAKLDISYHGVEGHAGYIDNWLSLLRSDSSALFKASQLASEACDYLLGADEYDESINKPSSAIAEAL